VQRKEDEAGRVESGDRRLSEQALVEARRPVEILGPLSDLDELHLAPPVQ
jgi:hypothetical protein